MNFRHPQRWVVAVAIAGSAAIGVGAPSFADTPTPSPAVSAPAAPQAVVEAATAYRPAVRVVRQGELTFPMAATPRCDVLDSFGDARSGGRSHEGVDMLATLGQEVYAAADGVLTAQIVDGRPEASLSGNAWRMVDTDGAEYFYAHLSGFADGLSVGASVTAGDLIGYVGDTGNPGAGNYHLHFEFHPSGLEAVDSLPLMTLPPGCRVY